MPEVEHRLPRSIVYQNPDFVAAMLQEIYRVGLLESSDRDYTSTSGSSRDTDTAGGGSGSLKASVPGLGSAELGASGERTVRQARQDDLTAADRSRFVYSQAYYLDSVYRELQDRQQISTIESNASAAGLVPGQIVEFQASFRPNEVNALLDIASPELVGEIARYVVRSKGQAEMMRDADRARDNGVEFDAQRIAAQRALHDGAAEHVSVVATAVARALKVDTRGETTKEFHATISNLSADGDGSGQDDLAAIVMCDTAHFVTDDTDRLLDGEFVVLAKVIRKLTPSTPILANNKLLHRIKPSALESLLTMLNNSEVGGAGNEYVDLGFPSDIVNAITVMPIAIYV